MSFFKSGQSGIPVSQKGVPNGVATLNVSGKHTAGERPTQVRYFAAERSNNEDNMRVKSVTGGGSHRFNFNFPNDFVTLVSLQIIGKISSGAAGSGKAIHYFSNYGSPGQSSLQHQQSDTTKVFDLTGLSGQFYAFDISSVVSNAQAGDVGGVLVDHQGIGGSISYIVLRLEYQAS